MLIPDRKIPKDKTVPVENVFNIFTDIQEWNPIKGFNGYEVSNLGYVRSLKKFKKHPYGVLINPIETKRKVIYVLTDNNNMRRRLTIEEIIALKDDKYTSSTINPINAVFSRNQRHFINFEEVRNVNKDEYVHRNPNNIGTEELFMPKFTVIDEEIKKPLRFHNYY